MPHAGAGDLDPSPAAGADPRTLLRSILRSIAEGVAVASASGKLPLVNPAAQRILGVPLPDVLPTSWPEEYGFFLPDQTTPYPPGETPLALAMRGVEVNQASVFLRNSYRPEGAWLSVNARPLRDDQGQVWGGIVVIRDVTEARRAEEQLRRANRALLAISSANQAVVRATDEAALLREVCRVVVETAGYRLCWVGYAEADETRTVRPVAQAGYEEGYLKTVNVTWADTERGRGPVGTAIRTRAPAVFQNAATDPHFAPWRAEALKRGYASILGLPLVADSAALGALAIYASEPDAFDEEEVGLLRTLAEDLAYGIRALRTRAERARAETELRQAHDELERRVAERTTELERANYMLRQEVAERRRAEESLAQAKAAAEAASRAKSTFLANMSHEIRTPLNGILGMTELALHTGLTAQQREYLATVRGSAEALLRLLNDILDFSKVEAGMLELEAVPLSLRDVLGDALHLLALRAAEKGLELACRVPADVPDALVGDPLRLRQVLINLVGNALKFTDRGEVLVTVTSDEWRVTSTEGVPADAHHSSLVTCHFSVKDTGIGIPAKKQRLIFQPFSQADASTTRRSGGTGLGLTIAAQLVELMGGRTWVESEVGKGSTFHFTARFGVQPGDRRQGQVSEDLRGLRVLVVDDNRTSRDILHELLTAWGMAPALAEDGPTALAEMTRAAGAGRPYRLSLLDARMPGMDGLALSQRIRKDPGFGSCALLLLSPAGQPVDAERSRELKIVCCLTKPVKPSDLLEAIQQALGPEGAEDRLPEEPGPGKGKATAPRRVLLVEDGLVNKQVAVGLLELRGHHVVVADNGKEALAALDRQAFDVVLMDVQMPEMDGLEATAAIRRQEQAGGHRVPIIAMTAHALSGDRQRCLDAGMDGYLSKPIRAEALYEAVEGVPPTAGAAAPGPAVAAPSPEVIDWAAARERVGGREELLRGTVNLFFEEVARLTSAIRQALAAQDASRLCRSAHTLKGAADWLAADAVVASALRLEGMGREENWPGAADAWAALEKELDRLLPVLAAYAKPEA
jgi:signal transduction histidine kinase/CheY-like chemotaxis protein